MMKIADLLNMKGTAVVSINQDRMVYDAVKVLFENKIGALLVTDDNAEIVGILSERDILRESYRQHEKLKEIAIKDVMTVNLIVGEPNDDLSQVKETMIHNRIRHLPVISKSKLQGVLSMRDIMEAELQTVQ